MVNKDIIHLFTRDYAEWESRYTDPIYWANRDPMSSTSIPDLNAALSDLVSIVENLIEGLKINVSDTDGAILGG